MSPEVMHPIAPIRGGSESYARLAWVAPHATATAWIGNLQWPGGGKNVVFFFLQQIETE
jgi:hypothetical protein